MRRYSSPRDHPRICGEHHGIDQTIVSRQGSSPHMRGTRGGSLPLILRTGIIPAYAGNTWHQSYRDIPFGDHPRICGEHLMSAITSVITSGSSPHMRGTPCRIKLWNIGHGIIPAYAGNTTRCASALPVRGDHPRICGEHHGQTNKATTIAGSSPHMRGTHDVAHVGSVLVGDHPRICGEHPDAFINDCREVGSSPHMRGTLSAL